MSPTAAVHHCMFVSHESSLDIALSKHPLGACLLKLQIFFFFFNGKDAQTEKAVQKLQPLFSAVTL